MQALADLPGGCALGHLPQQRRTVRRGPVPAARGQGSGQCHGHRARDPVRVRVRDPGGERGLLRHLVQVLAEPRTQRRNPHRRPVAQTALAAEEVPRLRAPTRRLLRKLGQQLVHAVPVAAVGVGEVRRGERGRQVVLVHRAVHRQDAVDRQRHRRVVRPVPRRLLGHPARPDRIESLLGGTEERKPTLSESVTEGQAFQGVTSGIRQSHGLHAASAPHPHAPGFRPGSTPLGDTCRRPSMPPR